VQQVIQRVRKKIDRAIDKLIMKAKKAGKKLLAKIGIGKEKKVTADEAEKAEEGEFTEEDRTAGKAAFAKEEISFAEKGEIDRESAGKVASKVKEKHAVFESVKIVDGEDSWDYQYVMRANGTEVTPPKKPTQTADKARVRARDVKKRAFQVADQVSQTPAIESELVQIATLAEGMETELAAGGVKTAQVNEMNKEITRLKDELKRIERETGLAEEEAGEEEKDHKFFKPQILDVQIDGDIRTVTFKYEDDKDHQQFTVRQRLTDFLTTSIEGKNLTFNPLPGMRGTTEAPPTHEVGRDMNAAHLIADWFGGSGYKQSLNLITTSDHFNKQVMGGVERKIADDYLVQNAASMNMTINVTWGKLLDEAANQEAEDQIKQRIASMTEAAERSSREERIEAFIAQQRSLKDLPPRICEEVTYSVTYKNAAGGSIATLPYSTGRDEWLK
jgi:hypothetical protein